MIRILLDITALFVMSVLIFVFMFPLAYYIRKVEESSDRLALQRKKEKQERKEAEMRAEEMQEVEEIGIEEIEQEEKK